MLNHSHLALRKRNAPESPLMQLFPDKESQSLLDPLPSILGSHPKSSIQTFNFPHFRASFCWHSFVIVPGAGDGATGGVGPGGWGGGPARQPISLIDSMN